MDVYDVRNFIITTGHRQICAMRGKYITIVYHDVCRCLAYSVIEHYDREENDNTLVMLNIANDPNVPEFILDMSQYAKRIYYNCEHYSMIDIPETSQSIRYFNYLWNWIDQNDFAEVWDFVLENIPYYPDFLKDKVKLKPPRYTTVFDNFREIKEKYKTADSPRYDLMFAGTYDTDLRMDVIQQLTNPYRSNIVFAPKVINLWGCLAVDSLDIQAQCKFVLDYPHYSFTNQAQNVIRIYEYVCLDSPVIAHVNYKYKNYFQNMICEAYGDNPQEFVNDLYYKVRDFTPIYNAHEQYKTLTYYDEDYKRYIETLLEQK